MKRKCPNSAVTLRQIIGCIEVLGITKLEVQEVFAVKGFHALDLNILNNMIKINNKSKGHL